MALDDARNRIRDRARETDEAASAALQKAHDDPVKSSMAARIDISVAEFLAEAHRLRRDGDKARAVGYAIGSHHDRYVLDGVTTTEEQWLHVTMDGRWLFPMKRVSYAVPGQPVFTTVEVLPYLPKVLSSGLVPIGLPDTEEIIHRLEELLVKYLDSRPDGPLRMPTPQERQADDEAAVAKNQSLADDFDDAIDFIRGVPQGAWRPNYTGSENWYVQERLESLNRLFESFRNNKKRFVGWEIRSGVRSNQEERALDLAVLVTQNAVRFSGKFKGNLEEFINTPRLSWAAAQETHSTGTVVAGGLSVARIMQEIIAFTDTWRR